MYRAPIVSASPSQDGPRVKPGVTACGANTTGNADGQLPTPSQPVRPTSQLPKADMGTKFNAQDASAYEALDRLLFREWDPIGVYAFDGPDDEYRAYLPEFWNLVSSGEDVSVVAEYLGRIERDRIELETSDEHRLDICRNEPQPCWLHGEFRSEAKGRVLSG